MKNLIFDLCSVDGVSGNENKVAQIAADKLKKYAEVDLLDNGSVIARLGNINAKKHIMLDAHIDQIGLIVTDIDDNGFLKVAACGGVDRRILPGSLVKVYGKNEFIGVISCLPPHLLNGESKFPSIDKMFVDLGMDKENIKDNVSLGDRVAFYAEPKELLNNRIAARSLDNRASVAALIRCAELLYNNNKLDQTRVTLLLSCQEETTSLGAMNSAFSEFPDESIVVDVSFAAQPDVSKEKAGILGEGPMIGIAPSLSKEVTNKIFKIAKECKMPYQTEVMGGRTGTNADKISYCRSGIKTGLISIPQRNMHTSAEIVDISDIEYTARLLTEYIEKGGAKND